MYINFEDLGNKIDEVLSQAGYSQGGEDGGVVSSTLTAATPPSESGEDGGGPVLDPGIGNGEVTAAGGLGEEGGF
jgi:hypothetical protein